MNEQKCCKNCRFAKDILYRQVRCGKWGVVHVYGYSCDRYLPKKAEQSKGEEK